MQGKHSSWQNHENILWHSWLHCAGGLLSHWSMKLFPFSSLYYRSRRLFCTSLTENPLIGGRMEFCSTKCWSDSHRLMAKTKRNCSQRLQITMFHIQRAWVKRRKTFVKGWGKRIACSWVTTAHEVNCLFSSWRRTPWSGWDVGELEKKM